MPFDNDNSPMLMIINQGMTHIDVFVVKDVFIVGVQNVTNDSDMEIWMISAFKIRKPEVGILDESIYFREKINMFREGSNLGKRLEVYPDARGIHNCKTRSCRDV